jgi:hypothetical protein
LEPRLEPWCPQLALLLLTRPFARAESYSTIALPNANSHTSRTLQEDNTDLAYEFARKFVTLAHLNDHHHSTPLTQPHFLFQPGYTAENLSEKGIHEVAARRFCLVAADHPLVSGA